MGQRSAGRLSAGIDGLNEVLNGGFVPHRSYMIRGDPGTGKTILGLHYLSAGVQEDEVCLMINFEETVDEILQNVAEFDFPLSQIEFLDLSPEADSIYSGEYDLFEPDEVEQLPLTEDIIETIDSISPDRVFLDPITHLQFLSSDPYQFRKRILALTRYLKDHSSTLLFTSQETSNLPDDDLQFIADGEITLELGDYGRKLSIPKFRGSDVLDGPHAVTITGEGMQVFPRMDSTRSDREFISESIPSGVPELDQMLNGGIERGTTTVISGPTGAGKTTTGTQFMKEAAGRGERSVLYLFEETMGTFLERSESVNIPISEMVQKGTLELEEIDPLDLSPEEFATHVRHEVEENRTQIVMIDGLDGYKLALRGDDDDLVRRLHSLTRYLKNMGVTTILIDETKEITGEFRATSDELSYMTDNLLFLRHLELEGELRKVVGVLKKRTTDFERMLRELRITEHGLRVGEPLRDIQGILRGAPEIVEHGDD